MIQLLTIIAQTLSEILKEIQLIRDAIQVYISEEDQRRH